MVSTRVAGRLVVCIFVSSTDLISLTHGGLSWGTFFILHTQILPYRGCIYVPFRGYDL